MRVDFPFPCCSLPIPVRRFKFLSKCVAIRSRWPLTVLRERACFPRSRWFRLRPLFNSIRWTVRPCYLMPITACCWTRCIRHIRMRVLMVESEHDELIPHAVVASVRALLDRNPVQVTRAILYPTYIGMYLVEIEIPNIVNYGPAELYIEVDGQPSNRVRVYIEP